MAGSASPIAGEKKHWWMTNRKVAEKYVKEARALMATHDPREIAAAVNLLETVLSFSPKREPALELKAKCLLNLRRFKEVADMLIDYIPSLNLAGEDDPSPPVSGESISLSLRTSLIPPASSSDCHFQVWTPYIKCFASVSELKKKAMSGICRSFEKNGEWRYLVLGQACSHLGLMEDAILLLQTGKRLLNAALRKESICWSEDSFSFSGSPVTYHSSINSSLLPPPSDAEWISQVIGRIKLLLRRRTAAIAALDAGLYTEAVRHFSKIVDGRRSAPQAFLAECYMHRATAYRSAGRTAESISDCNKALALDPTCIQALCNRASIFEDIRCLPDCLHDLEHLKLLYNSILRDRKLPGPVWRRVKVAYREIPGMLCTLTTKIQELKQVVGSGEKVTVDYYSLIGLRRGCSRSELERSHLLLCLRHKPDKAMTFIDHCEFADVSDVDFVKDRARISSLLLYRLIQRGHAAVKNSIVEEEEAAAEVQRKKTTTAASLHSGQIVNNNNNNRGSPSSSVSPKASVFQGVFCRDLAAVSSLLSQATFNRPLPLKYEALSC